MRVNDDYPGWNVKRQAQDPDSALSFWKQIISLRTGKFKDTLTYGVFHLLAESDENVFAYTREWDGEVLLCVLNFSASDRDFELDGTVSERVTGLLVGNYHDAEETKASRVVRLRPYEGRLFTLR
jgi:oligo-1,6-glucosidase